MADGLIRERGFSKEMDNGTEELRKAVYAVCATMLNPESALFKTISGGSEATRKTVKNAMNAILEKDSFTGGDLLSITNFSSKFLGNQSVEGAVKFAMQNVKLSNLAGAAPSAEALASMAQTIETDIVGTTTAQERAEINTTLKTMGGLSGLAKAIKEGIMTKDYSAILESPEIQAELVKEKSAVKKILEQFLGPDVSNIMTRYKEKGLTGEQQSREIEGMMFDQLRVREKAMAIDPVQQSKLIKIIESTVIALSQSPETKAALDKLGLT